LAGDDAGLAHPLIAGVEDQRPFQTAIFKTSEA
jgi:hypothetical protein